MLPDRSFEQPTDWFNSYDATVRIFLRKYEHNEWCSKQPKSKLKSQTYTRFLILLHYVSSEHQESGIIFNSFQFFILRLLFFSSFDHTFFRFCIESTITAERNKKKRFHLYIQRIISVCIHSIFFSLSFVYQF